MPKEIATYLFPVLIAALVAWRLVRQSRGRPLRPSRLWVRPAMLALFLGLAFLHPAAVTPLSGLVFAAAAVLGVVLGYVLASHQQLAIDAATGTITSTTSPVGIALFVGLFAARYAFRIIVTGGQAPNPLVAHSDQVLMYTDAGLVFVFCLVSAQAWEIWRRAKPLLAESATKKAASPAQ
jgi:hypothetical protein